jgi:putative tryptophan/tyrosine transport system substrate-binding protein
VNRRAFISALVSAACSRSGYAQQHREADRVRRIGVLVAPAENDPEIQRRLTVFARKLQDLGWAEGRNVQIERRFAAGDANRMQQHATELVAMHPDVIVAATSRPATLLRLGTSTIPILFVFVSDPIGSGLVGSMARPGGNITGFTDIEDSLSGKWLELLKEIAPDVARVAFLFNPDTMSGAEAYFLQPFEAAALKLGIASQMSAVRAAAEIEAALAGLSGQPGSGLVVAPDVFTRVHRELIITSAAGHSLPAIYPFKYFVAEGGLISYGIDAPDLWPRAAVYVDRILKGEKPADLPVQAPTKFELVINLKTAKALGISVPATLLARADEVIE